MKESRSHRGGAFHAAAALAAVLCAAVLWIAAGSADGASAAEERPLMRFPDVHGDRVAFVHAEEIWTAPVAGGPALRLTDDPGEDRQPRFSPDGSMIAWTSEAGGNADAHGQENAGQSFRADPGLQALPQLA